MLIVIAFFLCLMALAALCGIADQMNGRRQAREMARNIARDARGELTVKETFYRLCMVLGGLFAVLAIGAIVS